jgi:hypothetical protein
MQLSSVIRASTPENVSTNAVLPSRRVPENPIRVQRSPMSESYGHRITAIHANPLNKCDHCKQPALWETDYKFFGENEPRGSNPEQVCDLHAKQFAAKWPDAKFPVQAPN